MMKKIAPYIFPAVCAGMVLSMALVYIAGLLKFNYTDWPSDHLPQLDSIRFNNLYNEFSNPNFDYKTFLKGWFFGADLDSIRRQDILEWGACIFYNTTMHDMDVEQTEKIQLLMDLLEERMQRRLQDRAPTEISLPKIMLTTDKPKIYTRPMVYYAGIRFADIAGQLAFRNLGFKKTKVGNHGLEMFCRQPNFFSKELPIVIFHGLGIGVCTYVPFVAGLIKEFPNRTIILFEVKAVSMRLDDRHYLPTQFVADVSYGLEKAFVDKAVFVGHSIGTCCLRWMDMYAPKYIHSRIFIDPVCFLLWNHHIAYNALYRHPKTANQAIIKYIAMCEPGIAIFLHRYFSWFQNTYFTNELPKDCVIFLAMDDDIVDSHDVLTYLKEHNDERRQVFAIDNMLHGQLVFHRKMKLVFDAVRSF
ncbi:hypothetical protein HK103_002097 [Boothiomyces macroporosus]|uniref:AB hydrolase-1 domain-containing protein n=1 Tax=Boothiomyces macroporosus TaxID=261099 RepID=A0AAD5UJ21_9FUNG|nr:hypothetical protein HK103_002097 [Boothiomyces macroporosus]